MCPSVILYLLPGTTEEIRFPMSKGLVGDAVTTKSIVNVSDAYTDSRFIKAIDVKTGYRTQSVMCLCFRNTGRWCSDGSLIIVLLATGTCYTVHDVYVPVPGTTLPGTHQYQVHGTVQVQVVNFTIIDHRWYTEPTPVVISH